MDRSGQGVVPLQDLVTCCLQAAWRAISAPLRKTTRLPRAALLGPVATWQSDFHPTRSPRATMAQSATRRRAVSGQVSRILSARNTADLSDHALVK